MKPRIGLALSGGGSKRAFTVGVLKVIKQRLDHPSPYPVISGPSTGALTATLLTLVLQQVLEGLLTSSRE